MAWVKISEATNRQLDWLVAEAEGLDVSVFEKRVVIGLDCPDGEGSLLYDYEFQPTTNWSQGGTLMECKGIEPARLPGRQVGCSAFMNNDIDASEQPIFMYGKTYLQASMRCVAVNHFGETAEIPEELL